MREVMTRKVRSASSVHLERCPCGSAECRTTFLVLYDERDRPFARAGMLLDEWPKFIAEAAADVAKQKREADRAPEGEPLN